MAFSRNLKNRLRVALTSQTSATEFTSIFDVTTLGTVEASKAVTANASRNITNINSLSATTVSITTLSATGSGNTFATTAGTGITGGSGTVIKYSVMAQGTLIYSTIYIDLTGLDAVATDGDVIGAAGTNPAHLGQITAARNGTVDMGRVTCLELPAGASTDINLCTAIENTLKKDDAISGGTGVQTLVDAGGAWANGTVKGMLSTPITANNYIYLTNGAGASAGTYTAGKFLLEFYGF